MTTTTHPHDHEEKQASAHRVGMSNLAIAEHRRRIAEIAWLAAQAKAKIAGIEAALLHDPLPRQPRFAADQKLQIATIAFDTAQLKHEQAVLRIELAEDKAAFPR
jgi:hypothetical protein